MPVNFTGSPADYTPVLGNAVNFTGGAAEPDTAVCTFSGSPVARGKFSLTVPRGGEQVGDVVARYSPDGFFTIVTGTTLALSGRVQPKAAPMIEYPYVDVECDVSKRGRVTGVVQ